MPADPARVAVLKAVVRTIAARHLRQPGVTSIGVGCDGPGDEFYIRFTVSDGFRDDPLASGRLPSSIRVADRDEVPCRLVERRSFVGDESPPQAHPERTRRHDPVRPGISIAGNAATGPGTIGAIVYRDGRPLILSNWHVLDGPHGGQHRPIYQPGSIDARGIDDAQVGELLETLIGRDGDAAVATIIGRRHDPRIVGLPNCTPRDLRTAELGDPVVKSGRTTGVTYGIVSCVGVVTRVNYGEVNPREVGGFEIEPDPERPAARGEISAAGDSGSLWMLVDPETREVTNTAVGLQFAGEDSGEEEFAIACDIAPVLDALRVSLVPTEAWSPPPEPRPPPPAPPPGWGAFAGMGGDAASWAQTALAMSVPPPEPSSFGLTEPTPSTEYGWWRTGGAIVVLLAAWFAVRWALQIAPDGSTDKMGAAAVAKLQEISVTETGRIFALLTFIALLTERTMELFLNLSRGAEAEDRDMRATRRQRYVHRVRSWLAGRGDDANEFWRALLARQKALLAQEEKAIRVYRNETKHLALCVSATIGLLATIAGVRTLTPLIENPDGWLVHILDVLFTAGLVAGGSEGVHQAASAFTTAMKARQRENRARQPGA